MSPTLKREDCYTELTYLEPAPGNQRKLLLMKENHVVLLLESPLTLVSQNEARGPVQELRG